MLISVTTRSNVSREEAQRFEAALGLDDLHRYLQVLEARGQETPHRG